MDEIPPQLDRRLVRHKLAATGVINEDFSQRAVVAQIAEHIAAGAMEEVRDGTEDFALRALASAGSTE